MNKTMDKLYANTKGNQGIIYREDTGETIAVTYKPEDARLLAAAPELLAALEELILVPNKYRPDWVWENAQAAINSAKE